ncbi:MAG: response regulator transcription factor [Chloroflexi bacterium]|nr:response regulator transcription factor [Chloroflexota bacterium]
MNHPIRILLVDDSLHFLAAARDFLHLQDSFRVIATAMDGGEAVKQSRRLEPDFILLDLNLANTSGLDLIPIFKQHVPHAKIIVLTIMQEEPYRIAAMRAGADAFVHKTAMSKSLISVILELAKSDLDRGNNQKSHDDITEMVADNNGTQSSGAASESTEPTSIITMKQEPNS